MESTIAERLKTHATAKDKCQIGDDAGCNIVTQVASIPDQKGGASYPLHPIKMFIIR